MKPVFALPALVLSAAFSLSVFAADTPPAASAPHAGPCKDDVAKYCSGVQPGEGRIAACLKEHKEQVSAKCKKSLAKRRAQKKNHSTAE